MMKHSHLPCVVLLAMALALPSNAAAQTATEANQAVVAALEHAVQQIRDTESLVDGPVRLDHRIAEKRIGLAWTERSHDQSAVEAFTSSIGAQSGNFEELRDCPSGPRSCHLIDTSIALAASVPVLEGDAASIVVHAIFMTRDTRQPVHRASWEWTLERVDGQWAVVSTTARSAT